MKKITKCPLCRSRLSYFRDYSLNKWKGCSKCEDFEILIKEVEE